MNPWIEGHIRDEAVYHDGDVALARQIVESEYAHVEETNPECDCGGTAYYKATIGAYKCPSCGDLYDSNGDKY